MTGNGIPPPRPLGEFNDSYWLWVFGILFFFFLLVQITKYLFPTFFSKLTFGLFEKQEELTLAKQIGHIKTELENLKSGLGGVIALELNNLPKQMDHLVADRMNAISGQVSIDDLLSMREKIRESEAKRISRENFNQMIDALLQNSLVIRNRVFTLFASVNLWLLVFAFIACIVGFVSTKKFEISQPLLNTIFGLYVSVALFLVYVFRNSSARISVLLALREDQNHRYDAAYYVEKIASTTRTSKRDIDALKLFLVNHSEKEKGGDHPYEAFIKGISNSTVFLRGGKITKSEDKESSKAGEPSDKKS